MSPSAEDPDYATFEQWLHDALGQLYDPPAIQNHPLARLLAEPNANAMQRDQQLRRSILQGIERLRPEPGLAAQSPRWRSHQILELRYIAGLSPAEAMQELALSRSTYFREQARALEQLAVLLWQEWQQRQPQPAPAAQESREALARAEVERLSAHATWEDTDLAQLIESLRPIVAPLAQAKGATLAYGPAPQAALAHADRVLMRQAILGTITYALDVRQGGQVSIASFAGPGQVGIRIAAAGSRAEGRPQPHQSLGLDVCKGLMAAMGGSMEWQGDEQRWSAQLTWPEAATRSLLVIDDNEEFIDLFRRYLSGHGWRVIGATDAEAARQQLAEHVPSAIALDIMMPREDGWELLMALRASPRTQAVPVIICSVLNEPQLAGALGAAYLPKPISQMALLRALAQLALPAPSQARS
ncbi:response regulator [Chloroflexia bacterium SDU3-3]|nr:response regulator [Chloroflexia bacterium SDU3-3]